MTTLTAGQGRHFALLCRYGLGLPAPLAMAWWAALSASDDRECRWLARKFGTYRGSDSAFCKWIFWAIPPKRLVEALETLHKEGRLGRREATTIQDAILHLMGQGDWK